MPKPRSSNEREGITRQRRIDPRLDDLGWRKAELARREGRDYEPAAALLERIRAGRVGAAEAKRRKGKLKTGVS